MTHGLLERFEMLKAMHLIIKSLNNENAYYEWIYLIPDEATTYELLDCAMSTEIFAEACTLFTDLVIRYKSGGLYLSHEGNVYEL